MRTTWSWFTSLGLIVFLAAPALGNGGDDWQLWSSGSLQGRLGQRWKVTLEQQLRFQDEMSDLFYRCSDLGVAWKTASWLETGLHFAQICQKSGDDWREEHRPFLDGTIIHTWRPVRLSDRHRLERRVREKASNLWRYRNKLTLTGTSGWTRLEILPYVSSEAFIHLQDTDFYRWRLSGGFKGQLYEKLFIDISYLRQGTEAGQHWTHCHVLGTKLIFSL